MQTTIKYTLCFLVKDKKILMLWRNKPPWKGYWNGLGGKIESNEAPQESIIREMHEEAEIDISNSIIQHKGIVTWTNFSDKVHETNPKIGMHVFMVYLDPDFPIWTAAKHTKEGLLTWLDLKTVLKNEHNEIALNVPYFLKPMIRSKRPKEYFFIFKTDEDFKMKII